VKILTTLLDIGTAFLRLVEAEGRILRRAMMNFAWALAFAGVACFLVLVASGFFLVGVYQYLAAQMSPATASLLVAFLALLLALIFAGLARWRIADPK
jgi:hypothetical protein